MRAIRNISQRLLRLALLALIAAAVLAAGQTTPPAPASFATSHSIVVIGSNSPLFDSLLAKDFPGVDQVNYFQQIKPLLAIIHNNTLRVIKAYVVKWTITNSDGTTSTATLPVMWEPPPGDPALTGTITVLGPAGTGRGTQLISPYFRWPKRAFPGLLKINAVMISFQAVNTKPLVSNISNAGTVQVSVDGAIFGDGIFVGPDTTQLYERFQATQKARIDEAAWAQSQIGGGATVEQLRDALSQQIYLGRNAAAGDFYTAERGEQASGLMGLLDQAGQSGLRKFGTALAAANALRLVRMPGP